MNNEIENVSSLRELLGALGVEPKPKEIRKDLAYAMGEIRRHTTKSINEIFNAAVEATEGQLKYSSAKYLTTGLFGLAVDSSFTFWGPIKKVVNSPLTAELIKEEIGEEGTLKDLLLIKTKMDEEGFDKMYGPIQNLESFAEGLLTDSEKYDKPIAELLDDPEYMLDAQIKKHGSFEEYKKETLDSIGAYSGLFDRLDALKNMPIALLLQIYVSKNRDLADNLKKANVDLGEIGAIARDYLEDVSVFGKAYFTEMAKRSATKLQRYEDIMEERTFSNGAANRVPENEGLDS